MALNVIYKEGTLEKCHKLALEIFQIEQENLKLEQKQSDIKSSISAYIQKKIKNSDEFDIYEFRVNRIQKKIDKNTKKIEKLNLETSIIKFKNQILDDEPKTKLEKAVRNVAILEHLINKEDIKQFSKFGKFNLSSIAKKKILIEKKRKAEKIVATLTKEKEKEDLKKEQEDALQEQKDIRDAKEKEKNINKSADKAEASLKTEKKLEDTPLLYDIKDNKDSKGTKATKDVKKSSNENSESSERPGGYEAKKTSELVGAINFETLNESPVTEKGLEKLIGINTKIHQVLERIQVNQIDEQDTSIKTSSLNISKNKPYNLLDIDNADKNTKKENISSFLSIASIAALVAFSKTKLFRTLTLSAPIITRILGKFIKGGKLLWKYLEFLLKGPSNIVKYISKHLGITKTIEKKLLQFKTSIKDMVKKSIDSVLKFIKHPIDGIKKLADSIKDKTKDLYTAGKTKASKLTGIAKDLYTAGKTKASKLTSKAKNLYTASKSKASKLIDKTKDLYTAGKTKASKLTDKVKDIYNIAKSSKFGKMISEGVGKVVKFGKGVVPKLKGSALKFAEDKIMPALKKILGKKLGSVLEKAGIKGVLKTLGLNIPLVSLAGALGFGVWDAMHGHYRTAALDVLAGLSANIPFAGQVLSPIFTASAIGSSVYDDYQDKNKPKKSSLENKDKKILDYMKKFNDYNNKVVNIGIGPELEEYRNVGKNNDLFVKYRFYKSTKKRAEEVIAEAQDQYDSKNKAKGFNKTLLREPILNTSSKPIKTSILSGLSNHTKSFKNVKYKKSSKLKTDNSTSKHGRNKTIYQKLKDSLHIGTGPVSDLYMNVGKNKNLSITYDYNQNEKPKYSRSELIKKAQDYADGKPVFAGPKRLDPEFKSHVNIIKNKKEDIIHELNTPHSVSTEPKEKVTHGVINNIVNQPHQENIQVSRMFTTAKDY